MRPHWQILREIMELSSNVGAIVKGLLPASTYEINIKNMGLRLYELWQQYLGALQEMRPVSHDNLPCFKQQSDLAKGIFRFKRGKSGAVDGARTRDPRRDRPVL